MSFGTIGLAIAFVLVFFTGFFLGFGSGKAQGKVEVLESELNDPSSNQGESQ